MLHFLIALTLSQSIVASYQIAIVNPTGSGTRLRLDQAARLCATQQIDLSRAVVNTPTDFTLVIALPQVLVQQLPYLAWRVPDPAEPLHQRVAPRQGCITQ